MQERELRGNDNPQPIGTTQVGQDSSRIPTPGARSECRCGLADYLFASFVALAIVTILTPLRTLHALLPWRTIARLPLTTFQDLFLIAIVAWIFHCLLVVAKRPWARTAVAVAGWTVCLTLALYTYLS